MLGPKQHRDKLTNDIAILDGFTLASSTKVRNLGVIFDQDMSFNFYIKQISRTAFFSPLASLHLLPVKSRIEFKILLTYEALNDQTQFYLKEILLLLL